MFQANCPVNTAFSDLEEDTTYVRTWSEVRGFLSTPDGGVNGFDQGRFEVNPSVRDYDRLFFQQTHCFRESHWPSRTGDWRNRIRTYPCQSP